MNLTPNAFPSAHDWLSVADFAKVRGCSIRTVKRWIENGEVETRKDGARRFVRPLEKGHKRDAEGTQQKGYEPDSVSLLPSIHAQKEGRSEGTQRDTKGTQVVSLPSEREAQLRDELARERENTTFLRGVVEALQRDAIELRAIARDALKIAPRQLSAGEPKARGEPISNGTQTTPSNTPDEVEMSLGSDDLSEDELRALCFRVCKR